MEPKNISAVLSDVQSQLIAPKNQFNSFGNYKYRNCEDILEALKPILLKNGASVVINDEIVLIGDRFYVKATAAFCIGDNAVKVSAFAREPQERKGMDASQITGATSSYARKYALNGLFLIDDSKDTDATNNGHKEVEYITNKQVGLLRDQLINLNKPEEKFCAYLGIKTLEELQVKDLGKAQVAIDSARSKKELAK